MLPVRICAGGVGTTGVPTATGQHRVDEVTRTESRRLDSKNNPRIAAHRPPKETAGLRNAGVCAKGTKKESNTLDAADFVRDVANRVYHYLSQSEIDGAKRISLPGKRWCWFRDSQL